MKSIKSVVSLLLVMVLMLPSAVYGVDNQIIGSAGEYLQTDDSPMQGISGGKVGEEILGEGSKEQSSSDFETSQMDGSVSDTEASKAEASASDAETSQAEALASETGESQAEATASGKETSLADVPISEIEIAQAEASGTDASSSHALEEDIAVSEEASQNEEVVGAGPSNDAKLATGVYYICMKQDYKMFLGSKGNSEAHCSNIEIVQKNSSKKQKWVITALGNGRYSIWNFSSGMALGVAGVTAKDNANISQYRRNYNNVKQFYIRTTGDGAVIIQPVGASYVLSAASSAIQPGVNIRLAKYSGQIEAKWRCVPTVTADMTPGTYIIHSKLNDSKYVSIEGATRYSGGNCILSGTSSAKQMTVYSATAGKYLIHPACSNYTLTAYGNAASGSDVRQYKVTNAARQLWTFHDEGNGYYSIRSTRDNSLALDISGASTAEGTNVQLYKYNGSDAQLFSFEKTDGNRIVPNGYYALKSAISGKMAVEIAGNSKKNGANVQLGTFADKNRQKFYLCYDKNGYYLIQNAGSGLYIDVVGASAKNGTNVWQYENNASNAQRWKPVGSAGVFYFKSALGNVALDVYAAGTANGTNIDVYSVNNTNAQKFNPVPVTVTKEKEFIVAIDAGHQRHQNTGREPIGPGSSTLKQKVSSGTEGYWSHLNEYELNLQVSLKLQAELESRGYSVYMIRTTHDVDISNAERATMAANAGADIFIRIHANGADSSSVRGALMYMPSSSNRYLSQSVIAGSQRLARTLLDHYIAATGLPNLGLLEGDDMTGINWAKMPVTIVEMGFMSNRTDDLYMASESGQAAIVQGLANGVDSYFSNS